MLSFVTKQSVCGVSSGWKHSAVCTLDGRIFTFGNSSKILLGHDGGNGKSCLQPTNVIEGLEGIFVSAVVCGENHTAAISKTGEVFTWGWGGSFFSGCGALGSGDTKDRKRPAPVLFGGSNEVKIKKIACGRSHMIALGNEGEVWTWGHGENGRLGNGTTADQLEPFPVDYFLDLDIKCVDIACGNSFCLALSDDGKVYGWGKNDQSQLGLGGGISMDMYAMENMPRLIESLEKEDIIYIGAGASQSLAINANSEVFYWGNRLWMEPHKMSILSKHNIVQVDCGNGYSAALSDAGQIFTWGKGFQTRSTGVMGHCDTKRHSQPEVISSIADVSIKGLSCGNRHMIAYTGKHGLIK